MARVLPPGAAQQSRMRECLLRNRFAEERGDELRGFILDDDLAVRKACVFVMSPDWPRGGRRIRGAPGGERLLLQLSSLFSSRPCAVGWLWWESIDCAGRSAGLAGNPYARVQRSTSQRMGIRLRLRIARKKGSAATGGHFAEHRNWVAQLAQDGVDERRSGALAGAFHEFNTFVEGGALRNAIEPAELVDERGEGRSRISRSSFGEWLRGGAGDFVVEERTPAEHAHDEFGGEGVVGVESCA